MFTRSSSLLNAAVLVTALASISGIFAAPPAARAGETHSVRLVNNCGVGKPVLKAAGKTLSEGGEYTSQGPLTAAIAFLQTGECSADGGNCMTVETTLVNPTAPGSGSSSDLSIIPPLKFNKPASFAYFNGCDGVGKSCKDANCPDAFRKPDDNHVQAQCQSNNVGLAITFC